jgi:hypothetical protein
LAGGRRQTCINDEVAQQKIALGLNQDTAEEPKIGMYSRKDAKAQRARGVISNPSAKLRVNSERNFS